MKDKPLTLSRETIRQLDSNRPGAAGWPLAPGAACDTTSFPTRPTTR